MTGSPFTGEAGGEPTKRVPSRRFPPGSNLPVTVCGDLHPDDDLRCSRPRAHPGWHRHRGRTWGNPEDLPLLEPAVPPAGAKMTRLAEGALATGILTPEEAEAALHATAEALAHEAAVAAFEAAHTPGQWIKLTGGTIDAATTGDPAELEAAIRAAHPDAEVTVERLAVGGYVTGPGLFTLGEVDDRVEAHLPVEAGAHLTIINTADDPATVARTVAEALRLPPGARPVTAIPSARRYVLRSSTWDGAAPAAGDIVLAPYGAFRVVSVAYGAGLGHYRLEVVSARIITWTGPPPTPE